MLLYMYTPYIDCYCTYEPYIQCYCTCTHPAYTASVHIHIATVHVHTLHAFLLYMYTLLLYTVCIQCAHLAYTPTALVQECLRTGSLGGKPKNAIDDILYVVKLNLAVAANDVR